jgi:hypothetical protein
LLALTIAGTAWRGTPELGLNLLGWTSSGWPYVM